MSEKCRSFGFICYPDSTEYDFASLLEKASMLFDEYGYILHDQDLDQDGVFLKPHYHFYGRFKNPRSINSVSKALGLSKNQIDIVRSYKGAIRYLIHLNNPDKQSYEIEDIQTNMKDILAYFSEITEGEIVLKLINLRIEGTSIKDIVLYAYQNNCYSVFRRNYRIIADAGKEFRNDLVMKERMQQFHEVEELIRLKDENKALRDRIPEGFQVCLDDIPF